MEQQNGDRSEIEKLLPLSVPRPLISVHARNTFLEDMRLPG